MSAIHYAHEPTLDFAEYRRVLIESGMGAYRPIDDSVRLNAMLAGSDLVMTARSDGELAGFARCVTDSTWCCYVAELAVSASAQRQGIGQGLLDALRRHLGPGVSIILVSVPEAVGFYERAGMAPVPTAFWWQREG